MFWIFDARVLIENAIYYSAGAFALWKGGRAERLVAGALLVENTLSFFVQNPHRMSDPRYASLSLDVATLLVILFATFTTDRRWTLLVSALQILSMLTFIARIIDPTVGTWAYVTVDIAISFAMMATVVYGAITHRLRLPSPQ